MSLAPVPAEEERASCPNCSAPLAADQRYCLACGQPVSPVRLAFLDVLQSEQQPSLYGQGAVPALGAGYQAMGEPASRAYAWLRRYSGVLALLSVLLMSIIVGLLVGHWITQSRAPAEQVVKVEGLSGTAPASAGAAASTTAPAASAPATTKASPAKAEAAEAKEAKALEKSAAPKVVKASPTKLQKLGNTTGKKHEEEVAKLGSEPVETGG